MMIKLCLDLCVIAVKMNNVKIQSDHSFVDVLLVTSKMIMTNLVLTMMSVKGILIAVIFNQRNGVVYK